MNKTIVTLCALLYGSIVSATVIEISVKPSADIQKYGELATGCARDAFTQGNKLINFCKMTTQNMIASGKDKVFNGIADAKKIAQDTVEQAYAHIPSKVQVFKYLNDIVTLAKERSLTGIEACKDYIASHSKEIKIGCAIGGAGLVGYYALKKYVSTKRYHKDHIKNERIKKALSLYYGGLSIIAASLLAKDFIK